MKSMKSMKNMKIKKDRLDTDNQYIQQLRSLKKYCPKAYKYILFDLTKEMLEDSDGVYTINLPTSKEFKFVHGQIKLEYKIVNNKVHYTNILPEVFFKEGYIYELDTYKNIFFRTSADKFKIDLFLEMNYGKSI